MVNDKFKGKRLPLLKHPSHEQTWKNKCVITFWNPPWRIFFFEELSCHLSGASPYWCQECWRHSVAIGLLISRTDLTMKPHNWNCFTALFTLLRELMGWLLAGFTLPFGYIGRGGGGVEIKGGGGGSAVSWDWCSLRTTTTFYSRSRNEGTRLSVAMEKLIEIRC